jgi:hypothetical protein
MVPEDKPMQALQMLYNYIDKVDLSLPLNITNATLKAAKDLAMDLLE